MIDLIKSSAEESMGKTLTSLEREFASVRTGRANAAVLDRIKVNYYGVDTPINQLAGIKTPEATLLVVEPYDKQSLKDIEKAILNSDLGITPSNDGNVIRLPFPSPTEERRKELVKGCKEMAEQARTAIRNVRRDAIKQLEAAKKDGDIAEDDEKRAEKDIQKLTDDYIAKIDEAFKKKEAEVMEV